MAFWGLILEPHKKYTQTAVEQPFHVSMATLDLQNCDPNEETSSLVLRRGEADFILCNLSKKKGILNVPLNLDFEIGGQINFHILGNSSIHLTGYIVEEMEGFDSDDSLEEEEDAEDLKSKSDLFRNTKKLLEESTSKRKPDAAAQNKSKKVKTEAAEAAEKSEDDESDDDFDMEDDDSDDSGSGEEEEDDDSEEDDDDDDDEDEEDGDEETEAEKKAQEVTKQKAGDKKSGKQNNIPNAQNSQQGKKDKKAKNQNQQQQNKALNTSLQNKTANGSQPQTNGLPSKRFDSGVQIEELRVGNGPVAVKGKTVAVYYVGRLKQTNKIFDATQSGQGFKFRLGNGEVIKGWDVGVAGMKVGSKRRLTIPPRMAYGSKGAPPDIPPNSILVFEVELKNVS